MFREGNVRPQHIHELFCEKVYYVRSIIQYKIYGISGVVY